MEKSKSISRVARKALVCIGVVATLFATGCATGPKLREVRNTISEPKEGLARIYFYRTSYLGAALNPDVRLNGEVVGEASAGKVWFVDKAAGKYAVQISTETEKQLTLTLDAGQTKYVRFEVSMGLFVGHVTPELVDPHVGEDEILDCRYRAPVGAATTRSVAGETKR